MWNIGFVVFIISIFLWLYAVVKRNIRDMWFFISIMWLGVITMILAK